MRKFVTILFAVFFVSCFVVRFVWQDFFSISPTLSTPASTVDCTIPISPGETLQFSAQDLERRLAAESPLSGITILSLPVASQGVLYLGDTPVSSYDYIDRTSLDELRFVPSVSSPGASITFLPQSHTGKHTRLSIQVISGITSGPSIEDIILETMQNIPIQGQVPISEPAGKEVTIQVISPPQKGSVIFDGQFFSYSPYKGMSGTDQFTMQAVTSDGVFSREAVATIYIDKNSSGFSYTDMAGNPSSYAALMLHQRGVLSEKKVGGSYFFQPDKQMNRGDFLVLLIACSGLDAHLFPTVNTGLPNDTDLPLWLKPYIRAGIDAGIVSANQSFRYTEIPTRAEAVVMTDKAALITDVKEYSLQLPDLDTIPDWALRSYKNLAAYKMLDLYEGHAFPSHALTNSYAVDLGWQLYKYKHH